MVGVRRDWLSASEDLRIGAQVRVAEQEAPRPTVQVVSREVLERIAHGGPAVIRVLNS